MLFLRTGSALCVLTVCLSSVPSAAAQQPPFPDMGDTWYRYNEAVAALKEEGIIGGYPDGTFRPDDTINRAELLKIIFKGRSVSNPSRRCFPDVSPDAWYAPYVCTAKRRGIAGGYPDGTFRPGRTVNIAEAIKMTLRAYGREISEDGAQTWYAPYVRTLDANDVLPQHSYVPWDSLSRVRAADLIRRVRRYEEDGTVFRYSEGCGNAAQQSANSLTVEGRERSFLLTVPDGYAAQQPVPLVVAFHGRTNSNERVRSYYRLDRAMEDAVIAYPAALSNGDGTYSWSDPGDAPMELRDIAFFDALVEYLAETYCIDMDRIFVAGHSLGGWFANSVACVRGDVIRASATVGGASVITECRGPAAALIAHNPNDRLAPFGGSERNRQQRVERNACNWETQPVEPRDLQCVRHQACTENSVVFCPHENDYDSRGQYYPHNWPRGVGMDIAEFFRGLP